MSKKGGESPSQIKKRLKRDLNRIKEGEKSEEEESEHYNEDIAQI
jgi:hypothetical protein